MQQLTAWGLEVLQGKLKPWTFRLAFLIGLLTILPFAFTVFSLGNSIIPKARDVVSTVVDNSLPQDFEIKIKNGVTSTNQTEPFYVNFSAKDLESIEALVSSFDSKENSNVKKQQVTKVRLLTIDTNAKVEDYERYQTLYLLSRQSLVSTKDGHINVVPLSSVTDLTITKQNILDRVNEYSSGNYKKWGTIFLLALPFVALGLVGLSVVFIWITIAFEIWLINRVIRAGISFGTSLKLTVYLVGGLHLLGAVVSYIKFLNLYWYIFSSIWMVVAFVFAYYLLDLYKEDHAK